MLTISFCKRLLPDAREVVVMQLQFLDLLIAKENGAVPLDTGVRADLIDLMVRVLVVVFQEEGKRIDDRRCLHFQHPHFVQPPTILAWDLGALCRILPIEARSP